MNNGNLEILDVLTIISFALQMENQRNIVGISDVQEEVNRAVDAINQHLERQDERLAQIVERLGEIT